MCMVTSAFWMALDGRWTLGKAKAPPSTGWQLTPGRPFTTSENLFKLRAIELMMFATSCKTAQNSWRCIPKTKRKSHKSDHVIKLVWGISWLWRICHYFQSNLTQHWSTGVFREQLVDVFHDFWVYIYQFYISTTQTTPDGRGRSHLSILLQQFNTIFVTWIAVKALIAKFLIYHRTRIFTHWKGGFKTHSPIKPLEAEWKEASSTVSENGEPISNKTLL